MSTRLPLLTLCLALVPLGMTSGASPSPEEILRRADSAIAMGFPGAVLPELLALAERGDVSESEREKAFALAAHSLVSRGEPERALDLLDRSRLRSRALDFWRAQALLSLGRFHEAAQFFLPALEPASFPHADEAILGAARAAAGSGDREGALTLLGRIPENSPLRTSAAIDRAALLLDEGRPGEAQEVLDQLGDIPLNFQGRFTYLRALARFREGDPAGALLLLDQVQTGHSSLAERMTRLRADCLVATERLEEAEEVLQKFLLASTGDVSRLPLFQKLEALRATRGAVSTAELRRMASDAQNPLRAIEASFFLAREEARAGSSAEALKIASKLAEEHPTHPLAAESRLFAARLLIEEGRPAEAVDLLVGTESPRALFLLGEALFATGAYEAAMHAFGRASSSPDLVSTAVQNAALCGLFAGFDGAANPWVEQLLSTSENTDPALSFHLAAALRAAALRDPRAETMLEDLAPAFPTEANKALAEWKYLQADTGSAERLLEAVPDSIEDEDSLALGVFLADDGTDRGASRAVAAATDFLARFPESPRAGEVVFKLAELYFRQGNYLEARRLLEGVALAGDSPETTGLAWFLAGRASAKLLTPEAHEQAMLAYEEAAKSGGELAARARLEQALLLSSRGEADAAIVLFDRVVTSNPPPELRAAAIIEKGDVLFARGDRNPADFLAAADVWNSLADDPSVPAYWADQARAKSGAALEKAGKADEALQSYYRVFLEKPPASPDDFWYFKAGFEAARLLEERRAWREAIAVYDRLASFEGARATEADTRANRLRLENFLWEE